MMTLYELREKIRRLYQTYERYIIPVMKFLTSLVIFLVLNSYIGFYTKLASPVIAVLLALVGTVVPSSILVLLAGFVSLLHLYKASLILAVIALLVYLLLYLMFARFTPELGLVVLLMPVLCALNIPYIVPLIMGTFFSPMSIIAVTCGTAVYYVLDVLKNAAVVTTSLGVEEILVLATNVLNSITGNKMMFASIVIFAGTILVVYFLRRMKLDYSFEIAIGAGTFFSVLGFLVAGLRFGANGSVIIMVLLNLLCGFAAYVVHFMDLALDYSRTETTQFEDEDYYYYVKAVPKIYVTEAKKKITKYGGSGRQGRVRDNGVRRVNVGGKRPDYDSEEAFLREFASREEDRY